MNKGEKSQKLYKTDTIKKRAIYVYLPSIATVKRWKEVADKHNVSISKFVIEHVENSLGQEEDHVPRADLFEKLKSIKEENDELRKQNRILNKIVDNLELELRSFRLKPFLNSNFKGLRQCERELIDLLRNRKTLRSDEILEALNIDKVDSENIKVINNQLENLENYGLIRAVPGGWKWMG